MTNITVRKANLEEALGIDPEAESLPDGVRAFDSTDWHAHFLCGLVEGDWVVEIKDDLDALNWQATGNFVVQMDDDGSGFFRKLD